MFQRYAAVGLLLSGCAARTGPALVPKPFSEFAVDKLGANGLRTIGLKFLIPSAKRPPKIDKDWGYISPASESVKIVAAAANDVDLTASSHICHAAPGGRLCVVDSIRAVPKQPIVVQFYDGALNAKGHPTGNALSYGKAVPQLGPRTRYVHVYQNGFIDRIAATLATANPPSGVVSTTALSLALYDAGGFVIPQPTTFYSSKYTSYGEPKPFPVSLTFTTTVAYDNDTFSFVNDGHAVKGTGLILKQSSDVGLRYQGRGVREARLKVVGPNNTATIDITPKPGFASTIALPSLGPDAKICSEQLGTLWYTEPAAAKIAGFNPKRRLRQEYAIASGRTPLDIACVKAELGYSFVYVALSGDVLGELFKNHVVEHQLPTAGAGLHSVAIQSSPEDNASFTEQLAGKIGIYSRDPLLGTWFEFPVPAGGHPTEIRGEWFSDPATNAVGTIDSTPAAVEFALPHAGSQPGALAIGGPTASSDPLVWFVELAAARIGFIDPRGYKMTEYATAAPLQHLAIGWDGRVYATDSRNQVESIDAKGHVRVIGHLFGQLLNIVAGGDADLWILTWSSKGSSLVEVVP